MTHSYSHLFNHLSSLELWLFIWAYLFIARLIPESTLCRRWGGKGRHIYKLGCDRVENERERDQKKPGMRLELKEQACSPTFILWGEVTNSLWSFLTHKALSYKAQFLVSTDSHTLLLRQNKTQRPQTRHLRGYC